MHFFYFFKFYRQVQKSNFMIKIIEILKENTFRIHIKHCSKLFPKNVFSPIFLEQLMNMILIFLVSIYHQYFKYPSHKFQFLDLTLKFAKCNIISQSRYPEIPRSGYILRLRYMFRLVGVLYCYLGLGNRTVLRELGPVFSSLTCYI